MTGPDDIRAAMGWQQRHPALEAKCPHCQAPVGQRCTSPSGRRQAKAPHLARVEAVEQPPPSDPQRQPPYRHTIQ